MVAKLKRKVDWISWTHEIEPPGEGRGVEVEYQDLWLRLRDEVGVNFGTWLLEGCKPLEHGRSPYSHGFQDKQRGITIWYGGRLTHFTVELSAKGVDAIEEAFGVNNLLCLIADRVTRIDIAVDMLTDISPKDFVAAGHSSKSKTHAEMTSQSGETSYVGSMHSERYARVYRYNPPHPRSPYLRVEHVFRRKYAKSISSLLCSHSLRDVCATCRELFGWQHELSHTWHGKIKDIEVPRAERNSGKTLYWLVAQVVPAFRKLVEEGVIDDPVRFCEMYFLSDHSRHE